VAKTSWAAVADGAMAQALFAQERLEELREDLKRACDALDHAINLAEEGWEYASPQARIQRMVGQRLESCRAVLEASRAALDSAGNRGNEGGSA
jgi:hypothetical protein